MKIALAFLALCLVAPPAAVAESPADAIASNAETLPPTPPSLSLDLAKTFAKRLFWDTGYLLTAPARWDRGSSARRLGSQLAGR